MSDTYKVRDYIDKGNPTTPIVVEVDGDTVVNTGLSKREYFAAMAMQAMLSSRYVNDFSTEINNKSCDMPHGLTNNAVRYADALLKELEK